MVDPSDEGGESPCFAHLLDEAHLEGSPRLAPIPRRPNGRAAAEIHHISIPATDTRHVAEVLVELFDGVLTRFGPYQDSWIAWVADDHGTAIEVYPVGTEMYPSPGRGQAQFRHNSTAAPFVATHATVSVDRTVEEIQAVGGREGWRAVVLSRGPHEVVEFWIENAVMLELMTPEMTAAYLAARPRR